jgi:hypothetical protein
MYTLLKSCRACSSTDLSLAFSLGLQPPSNDFCTPDQERAGFAPLEILFCHKCKLSQLSVIVDPEILYRRYLYCTSRSLTMKRHFERLMLDVASEQNGLVKVTHTGLTSIVEIGSNTGDLLAFCKGHGYSNVLGIDPARNLSEMAWERGIQTIPEFFDRSSAKSALEKIGSPSVIMARHCFAHMHDWRGFVDALEVLANPKTLICIEVPWVHDMLKRTEFDTAYFEHLSYVNLFSVFQLLMPSPFRIHRICHYSIHGGALLIMLRHKDSGIQPHLSSDEFLGEDTVTIEDWQAFSVRAHQKINRLRDTVMRAIDEEHRVCGFGASAKMSVWLNATGLNHKQILFVSDNSPLKPGTLVPGTKIPVISQDELLSEHPDYAFVGAWNFRNEILETQSKWRERGGKFIFPTVDGIEIV